MENSTQSIIKRTITKRGRGSLNWHELTTPLTPIVFNLNRMSLLSYHIPFKRSRDIDSSANCQYCRQSSTDRSATKKITYESFFLAFFLHMCNICCTFAPSMQRCLDVTHVVVSVFPLKIIPLNTIFYIHFLYAIRYAKTRANGARTTHWDCTDIRLES